MTTPHQQDTWGKLLAHYGFAATLCAGVLWFVGYKMVLPTQEMHKDLVKNVADVNEKNAVTALKNAETAQSNAETNRLNAETQSRQTAILERIDQNTRPRQVSRSEER